ncbi:hypothetical protein BH10CHL1_BH10CHL1_41580 [soil metagenome]
MNPPFCFHIIYTAGTVRPLSFLLYSLLKWSNCTLRLVTNGCSSTEQRALQKLCSDHLRLSYLALPTRKQLPHGEALNYLQAQNQDDYFCFMDSDIYATGKFLSGFIAALTKCAGVFSGSPLRYPLEGLMLPERRDYLAGPHSHTQQGLCLGMTFFAIYHNATLTAFRRSTGVGFERYQWQELPAHCQQKLLACDLNYQRYDTAKILNLLLQWQGTTLCNYPSTTLRHLEAFSRLTAYQNRPWWSQIKARGRDWLKGTPRQGINQTIDEHLPYFHQLLLALHTNQTLPRLPRSENSEIAERIQRTTTELVALHTEAGAMTL